MAVAQLIPAQRLHSIGTQTGSFPCEISQNHLEWLPAYDMNGVVQQPRLRVRRSNLHVFAP